MVMTPSGRLNAVMDLFSVKRCYLLVDTFYQGLKRFDQIGIEAVFQMCLETGGVIAYPFAAPHQKFFFAWLPMRASSSPARQKLWLTHGVGI
jgi:hypothetical protein